MEEAIKEKLKKLKELCEKGVGGEKTNALKLYNEYILKHEIDENEIESKLSVHIFIFHNYIERQLLTWVYYQVVGDFDHKTIKFGENENALSALTTQVEADEINFLFNFYLFFLEAEVRAFVDGFCQKQKFRPDAAARRYKEGKLFLQNFKPKDEINAEMHTEKVLKYAQMHEKKIPIHKGIGN